MKSLTSFGGGGRFISEGCGMNPGAYWSFGVVGGGGGFISEGCGMNPGAY